MNVDAIFDAFADVTARVHKADELRKKQQEIAGARRKECGNCWHWMKSTCKPEKDRGEFKSMSSYPCRDFNRDNYSTKRITTLEAELSELKAEPLASKGGTS